MKNRKREICTSGSVRDEDGQPPHLLGRRNFLHLAAGAAAFSAVSSIAWAQSYPARTVTIIVPFAAGGTTDVAARIIGEYMSQLLGQQFIVENVTGAGGTTGSTRDRTLDDDNVHKRLLDLGGNVPSKAKRGQQPLAALVKGDIARWTRLSRLQTY